MAESRCPVSGHGENERRWTTSEELLKESNELVIVHNHQPYKLRLTRNGKLILTK